MRPTMRLHAWFHDGRIVGWHDKRCLYFSSIQLNKKIDFEWFLQNRGWWTGGRTNELMDRPIDGQTHIRGRIWKLSEIGKRERILTSWLERRISWTRRFIVICDHSSIFSRHEATLYEGVSVHPSVGPSVGWIVRNQLFFGLLGATNAVYTALFFPILVQIPNIIQIGWKT